MRRSLALLATIVLMAACSSEGGAETTTSTTTSFSTTTAAPTTTTIPAATTSTAAQPSTTLDPLAPLGSGCTPGTAILPDGRWFGIVDSYDETGISFDLSCWFSGEAAVAASAEDGEESPPPNDYYIRNENTQLRLLGVSTDTQITWYPSGDPNDAVEGAYAEWTVFLDGQDFRNAIWVTIVSGMVTEIEEQWVP